MRIRALLLVVMLAGCVDSGSPPVGPSGDEAAPWSISYTCAPGRQEPIGDVCYGRLADPVRTFGEPQAALHPTDDDVFAIGLNEGRLGTLETALGSIEPRGVAVYITTDGGANFDRHPIDIHAGDLPYQPSLMAADPSVVFADDGTLHVTLLAITRPHESGAGSFETRLLYTSTADLGATWTSLLLLDGEGYNDRQWMAAAPEGSVAISWRQHDVGGSRLMLGPDSEGDLVLPDCKQISNLVWVDDAPRAGCLTGAGDFSLIDALDGRVVGTSAGGCPSNSVRLAAGPGVLAASCYYGTMTFSLDGGTTWSEPVNIFDFTSIDDNWPPGVGPNIFAWAVDATGMVHATLTNFVGFQNSVPPPYGQSRGVAHVVINPFNQTIIHELTLQEPASSRGPGTYGFADDFYSISFQGDRGLMVWTSGDWATHFAVLDIG